MTLPLQAGRRTVTDGGLETDLIFHRGVDLPGFAAFPLLDSDDGRALLRDYFLGYADIARAAGAGLLLEAGTWRANPDWGARLGYDAADLARVNRAAVEQLHRLREQDCADLADTHGVVVAGMVGPRGDGYVPGERMDPAEAADYHRPQLEAFAAAGAELAAAYTLVDVGEAVGVVQAARAVGLPVAVSFTVETDGRLPDGTTLAAAIGQVDAAAPPDWFLVNCAHPSHVARGADEPGRWRERVLGLRYNASARSHADLDADDALDEGDPADLAAGHRALRDRFPSLTVLGGCCGTDTRHVAALWGVAGQA